MEKDLFGVPVRFTYKDRNLRDRKYRINNREKRKVYAKAYNARNAAKRKNNVFKKRYGITSKQFDELLMNQNCRCAVCGTAEFGRKGPVVDHCHASHSVRGILCCQCNIMLGMARDSVEILSSAINYLGKIG